MPVFPDTIGIILAGGQSSRMGKDKALLPFRGKFLIDHMLEITRASGVDDIRVSGDLTGYDCIPDLERHAGPAAAMHGVLRRLDGYRRYLFVPVDMPLLTPSLLHMLLRQNRSCFFEGYPLPTILVPDRRAGENISDVSSVTRLLDRLAARQISLPEDDLKTFMNTNTPEQWKEAAKHEAEI